MQLPQGVTQRWRGRGLWRQVDAIGAALLGATQVIAQVQTLAPQVVSAGRLPQPAEQIADSVRVLDRGELAATPAATVDGVLRGVPAFSLFRRSDSFSANPTAQGVSLRGIGPSGVSRTLVLLDGVPFNDPFGGWVYWTRVPMENVDRIEIVEGPSSNLYGNYAMGGVINLISQTGEVEGGSVQVSSGLDYDTYRGDFSYGGHLSDTVRDPADVDQRLSRATASLRVLARACGHMDARLAVETPLPDAKDELKRRAAELVGAARQGERDQVLLGVTGSGKTFTMANVIAREGRPTIVFAPATEQGKDGLKGSGRSITGFHLRDALDLVSKQFPELILKFGGHAMAAGLSIDAHRFDEFKEVFEITAQKLLDDATLERKLFHDGPLECEYIEPQTGTLLSDEVWGQGFPAPVFVNQFEVLSQSLVSQKHLKLQLKYVEASDNRNSKVFHGIWFGRSQSLPQTVRLAYRLVTDYYQGVARVQLHIEGADEAL